MCQAVQLIVLWLTQLVLLGDLLIESCKDLSSDMLKALWLHVTSSAVIFSCFEIQGDSRNQSFGTNVQQLFWLLVRIHLNITVVKPSLLRILNTDALSEQFERYPSPLHERAETSKVCGDTGIVV